MRARVITAACLSIAALCGPTTSIASARTAAAETVTQATAGEYLQAHPGGTLTNDDTVTYPDGTVFIALPDGTSSLSQCPSERFCLWSSANYSGSLVTKSGDGSTLTISSSVYSVWNNRDDAARLYNSDDSASFCLDAGGKKPSVAAAYHHAEKVHLSTASACAAP